MDLNAFSSAVCILLWAMVLTAMQVLRILQRICTAVSTIQMDVVQEHQHMVRVDGLPKLLRLVN